MATWAYICPRCETEIAKWEFTAPPDFYRCYQCGLSTPFKDLPKKDRLRTWTPAGRFGRGPIVVTFKGSATDTVGSSSLTIPSVSANAGDLLMCVSMTDGFVDQGTEFLRTNLIWGSLTGFGNSEWRAYEFHTNPAPNTNVAVDGTDDLLTASGTNNLVVDYSFSVPSNTKVAIAFTISGLENPSHLSPADFWYFLNQSNTFGSGTVATATPVLMRRAESVVVQACGITGPSSDTAGTWGNSHVRIARVGTTTGTPNIILDVSYVLTDSIQTVTGVLSGFTSRPWLIVPTIFDRP